MEAVFNLVGNGHDFLCFSDSLEGSIFECMEPYGVNNQLSYVSANYMLSQMHNVS